MSTFLAFNINLRYNVSVKFDKILKGKYYVKGT